jgi:hypothetical protein
MRRPTPSQEPFATRRKRTDLDGTATVVISTTILRLRSDSGGPAHHGRDLTSETVGRADEHFDGDRST